jgi:hypothetical protein
MPDDAANAAEAVDAIPLTRRENKPTHTHTLSLSLSLSLSTLVSIGAHLESSYPQERFTLQLEFGRNLVCSFVVLVLSHFYASWPLDLDHHKIDPVPTTDVSPQNK